MPGRPRTMAKRATQWQHEALDLLSELLKAMPNLDKYTDSDPRAELWRRCAAAAVATAESAADLATMLREKASVIEEELGFEPSET